MRLPFSRAKVAPDERAPHQRSFAGVGADDSPVQVARRRARRRLVGALVLVAAGVLGFPILFETQPRPLPVDTPIIVPAGALTGPSARMASAPAARPLPALPTDAGNETVAIAPPLATSTPASVPASMPASVPVPASRSASVLAAAKPEARAAKPALALAASAPASEIAADGRFVVQVGAYNDVERMRAARQKLEKLGYKTYTQEVDTPSGKRTRVRVGPFSGRPEAEAVASRVKASGMQANVVTL